ncbi:L-histidine N(alpha)-methyltransferase [Achromobacter sp. GG226]|uniref:L-histidine N(alpha)-methyltransferase n=1 Tax=Verticiella alkaliphila TaxID=2779529 RepID=UPI001C0C3BC0|nr:L-histidine N(alpha)-methyltransferase [Verticiella sp. GG226]MBU4611811.1 L-histidine N(alpha)-methyltransferase [Verticiella sp. GG226]
MHVTLDMPAAAPRYYQTFHPDTHSVRDELEGGLCRRDASIAPKFLYDALGSCLFGAITQVPEYYPTRTEQQIMARYADEIAQRTSQARVLVDLGAGDCVKAERLFGRLRPRQYVPVDISTEYLRGAVARLHTAYPDLDIVALGQDFSQTLALPDDVGTEGRLFFYPGSSIGNWAPEQALAMLARIRAACMDDGSGLLIGVDRVKSPDVLVPAYDDALQVTAAFNRNLLLHVNRLLRTDFALDDWRHLACFNAEASRMEMHLVATRAVTVNWPGRCRIFASGESIHTECSYKYQPQDFAALLDAAGFSDVAHWTDPEGWFSVFHARA